MKDLAPLAVKAADGGVLVVVFALIGTVVQPKRFAGLWSAAPSIALANLVVEVTARGDIRAAQECLAMICGGAGFVAFCVVMRTRLRAVGAARASMVSLAAWAVVAGAGYLWLLR